MTDIHDPKIDEKPPPYECSSCGVTTWSWNEAKHHICKTDAKPGKKSKEHEIRLPSEALETRAVTGQQVEELVRMTLEARTDHPDWADDQIIRSVMRSYSSAKHAS